MAEAQRIPGTVEGDYPHRAAEFVRAYHAAHRCGPSLREVADALGCVPSSALKYLREAEALGLVARTPAFGRPFIPVEDALAS